MPLFIFLVFIYKIPIDSTLSTFPCSCLFPFLNTLHQGKAYISDRSSAELGIEGLLE